jgi:hypothetical protein
MNIYTFRAEILADVIKFIELAKFDYEIVFKHVLDNRYNGVEVKLYTSISYGYLMLFLNSIPDGHRMEQTLTTIK